MRRSYPGRGRPGAGPRRGRSGRDRAADLTRSRATLVRGGGTVAAIRGRHERRRRWQSRCTRRSSGSSSTRTRRSSSSRPASPSRRGRSGCPSGSLLFSDMPGDMRRRWHPEDGVQVLRDPSNKCNGMTLDDEGNLIVCEHVTSSVVRERPDGVREVLASHWGRSELNSPNDVCVASDGSILVLRSRRTGACPASASSASAELGWQGVFRIPPGGGDLELSSPGRVRAAERSLLLARRVAALRQRHRPRATSRSTTSARTARSRTAACSSRASATGVIEEGIPSTG